MCTALKRVLMRCPAPVLDADSARWLDELSQEGTLARAVCPEERRPYVCPLAWGESLRVLWGEPWRVASPGGDVLCFRQGEEVVGLDALLDRLSGAALWLMRPEARALAWGGPKAWRYLADCVEHVAPFYVRDREHEDRWLMVPQAPNDTLMEAIRGLRQRAQWVEEEPHVAPDPVAHDNAAVREAALDAAMWANYSPTGSVGWAVNAVLDGAYGRALALCRDTVSTGVGLAVADRDGVSWPERLRIQALISELERGWQRWRLVEALLEAG